MKNQKQGINQADINSINEKMLKLHEEGVQLKQKIGRKQAQPIQAQVRSVARSNKLLKTSPYKVDEQGLVTLRKDTAANSGVTSAKKATSSQFVTPYQRNRGLASASTASTAISRDDSHLQASGRATRSRAGVASVAPFSVSGNVKRTPKASGKNSVLGKRPAKATGGKYFLT